MLCSIRGLVTTVTCLLIANNLIISQEVIKDDRNLTSNSENETSTTEGLLPFALFFDYRCNENEKYDTVRERCVRILTGNYNY